MEYTFPEEESSNHEIEDSFDSAKVFQVIESEEETTPDATEDRTVRSNCSKCEKMFEVDLPEGVDKARTACPHCGSIETVELA